MVVIHPSTRELAKFLHSFFLSEVVQQKHQSATSNYIGYNTHSKKSGLVCLV